MCLHDRSLDVALVAEAEAARASSSDVLFRAVCATTGVYVRRDVEWKVKALRDRYTDPSFATVIDQSGLCGTCVS